MGRSEVFGRIAGVPGVTTVPGDAKRPRRPVEFARPCIGDEELAAIREVLESGWLTQGPKVAAFEQAFARRHERRHAVAVTSGTTALHLALAALGIGPGDEVIVPAFTWVATANAALYVGATPVFVDVEADSYNIDCTAIADAMTPRTRAIIPVHLFGLCADMDGVRTAIPEGVRVVEDAACAAGAAYKGRPAGSMGDVGCYSFHPRKSITTGEGGMLVTDDDDVAATARVLRNHGASLADPEAGGDAGRYRMPDIERLGFNFRMSDVQAALGLAQLAKLDRFIEERNRWSHWYVDQLADIAWLRTPCAPEDARSAWQAYVAVVNDDAPVGRDEIMARLQDADIATRPGTHAVTELGYYRQRFSFDRNRFPVASRLAAQTIALPLHNGMTAADYDNVVEALHEL